MINKIGNIRFGSINFEMKKKTRYKLSNENLLSLIPKVKKMHGITDYFGICGGGTQNLFLLSLITKKNKLKSITIIDSAQEQPEDIFFTYQML